MVEIIKIDDDTFEELHRTRIDVKVLKGIVAELNLRIQEVKTWPNMVPNIEKEVELDRLKQQKQMYQDSINELKAVV
jgi:hypothetical protein